MKEASRVGQVEGEGCLLWKCLVVILNVDLNVEFRSVEEWWAFFVGPRFVAKAALPRLGVA